MTQNCWDSTIPIEISKGGTGVVSLTDGGILLGSGTGAITATGQPTNGQVLIGSSGADPVLANLGSSGSTLTVTNGAGTINLDLSANVQTTAINGWNGSLLETASITITSDGATITCSVEKSGGGDLTAVFSDGFYNWDTSPADTVTLTAGTDTSPQINYIYFLQSNKTLTASTAGWPATELAPIAEVYCQSAATLQTKGPYFQQNWTDHLVGTNNEGHIDHINFWIRQQRATWSSGVAQTFTITTNGGAADNVTIETAQGVVLQLHEQTFPAFSNPIDYYVVNDSVTPYNIVTDLNALLTDSTGASMSGKYFSLVLWGSASQTGSGHSKMYINLPGGSYNTQAALEIDESGYANFTIPDNFKSTGFLIAEWKLRHQAAASGTWTSIEEVDLRGLEPAQAAGGSLAVPVEFDDALFRIFDNGDSAKKIAFEASGITSGQTRTITMPDYDVDLGTVVSFVWNVENGASVNMAVNNGYIANNAGTCTLTLPDTAAVGEVIKVTGLQGSWVIAQNAGDTIHFSNQSTTTGAGGSLASTDSRDSVELICVVANTDFQVINSVGNLTVT